MSISRFAAAIAVAGTGLAVLVVAPAIAAAHPCDHPGTKAYALLDCARKRAPVHSGHVAIAVKVPGLTIALAGPPLPPPPPLAPVVVVAPPAPPEAPEPWVEEAPPAPASPPPGVHDHCCMAPREPEWGPPPAPVAPPPPPPPAEPVVAARAEFEPRYGLGVHGIYGGMVGDARSVSGAGFSIRLRPIRFLQLELSSDFLGGLKDGDKRLDVLPMASVVARAFPRWPIGIYGLAGAGASLVGIGGNWDAAPAFQLGAGVELRLGRRFAVTADVRWVRALNGGAGAPATVESACTLRPDDPRCVLPESDSGDGTDRVGLVLGAAFYF